MNAAIIKELRSFSAKVLVGVVLFAAGVLPSSAVSQNDTNSQIIKLGSIAFPNSGSAEAQNVFLIGMKALHSFEFEAAAEAFLEAQSIDPYFALAYWGEALSFNHPLWNETDVEAALATLSRFAPNQVDRSRKATAGRERGLMEAVDILFGDGDKLTRDTAYSNAMKALHEAYPQDDEVATLYALSILGTVRPGDKGFSRQMRAGAIALDVFQRNPRHPGAAHLIIHAFDDPEHAILALPAAKVYADIAPAAAHALHMPSHIFVQLGMWDGVIESNKVSYKAALEHAVRKGIERGRSEYHALQWYAYGHLQLENYEDAKWALDEALQTYKEFPTQRVRMGTMRMLARFTIETERWSVFDHEILTNADKNHTALHLAAGLSGLHRGDMAAAGRALVAIRSARERFENDPETAYLGRVTAVEVNELEAAIALEKKDKDSAEAFFLKAATIESGLNAPSGPPLPMKPSFEMYGEFLLDEGRFREAEVQFNKALERTPNRTKSMRGLEKSRSRSAGQSSSSDTASLQ